MNIRFPIHEFEITLDAMQRGTDSQYRSAYGVPYTIKEGTIRTTVSIGIAKFTPDDIPVPVSRTSSKPQKEVIL